MKFNPEMLVLAREAKGIVQEDFARLMEVNQATVSRWEAGLLEPTDATLAQFSGQLDVTEELFFRSDRVYGFNSTVFFHRKRQTGTDKALRKLHARMNILRMRLSNLLRSAQIEATNRFESLDPSEYKGNVEIIAQKVRGSWRMPMGHVRSVVKLIEEAGGIVCPIDFETNKIDAISEWVPGAPPIVLLNSSSGIPTSRLRWTLAHEIGHLIMHQMSDSPTIEDEANRFAREFLMPRREIKASLYRINLAKLMDLKKDWKVSMAALVYHAQALETITPTQNKYFNIHLRKRWGIHEPLEEFMPEEKPSLLPEILRAHVAELGYTPAVLAKMLFYTQEEDFEREFLGISRMRLVR